MYDDLTAAWISMRTAIAEMMAGSVPKWPWDRTSSEFLENQRLRDRVQGRGMRFASIWNANADDIRATVMGDRETYPEFHAKPIKGETPDPTAYMQSATIMPRIMVDQSR